MCSCEVYESWRDLLISVVRSQICNKCQDKRKQQYKLDYDNPLNCGCRCERVDIILKNAKEINDVIELYS